MEDLLEAAFQDMARIFPGSVEVFGHFGGFGGQPEGFGFDTRTSGKSFCRSMPVFCTATGHTIACRVCMCWHLHQNAMCSAIPFGPP